jgi:hypothetical protein
MIRLRISGSDITRDAVPVLWRILPSIRVMARWHIQMKLLEGL